MTDPRVQLKNPWLAALLAYLIPGAGHWYQGRRFKAVVYFVCIVGLLTWGCSMGEAKAVHLRWDKPLQGVERQRTLGFLAQAGIGSVALPALAQFYRVQAQEEDQQTEQAPPGKLIEEFDTPFSGALHHEVIGNTSVSGRLTGKLAIGQHGWSAEFDGRFVGQTSDGKDVDLQLFGSKNGSSLDIGPRITGMENVALKQLQTGRVEPRFAGNERRFFSHVVAGVQNLGELEGSIPRPFVNHFFAPLSDDAMKHLLGTRGKFYELALVYTWIAGLLNVLAIWDALQGPAYGYGDEVEETPASSGATPPQAGAATGVTANSHLGLLAIPLLAEAAPMLGATEVMGWYLLPLAAGISLVYSASRYELTSRIVARAVRLFATIVGFMLVVLVVLMLLDYAI